MQYLRKIFFFFLFGFFVAKALAADITATIQPLVADWNTIHNTKEVKSFAHLYADQVLFYGKYRTGKYCVNRKTKFLNQHFSQRIISPITIQYFSSGTVKCSFVKEVTYKEVVKEHASYLLLKEVHGAYKITGESDLETDKKLNVQLDLGEELVTANSKFWIYITAGLGVIGGLTFVVLRKKKTNGSIEPDALSDVYVSQGQTFTIESQPQEPVLAKAPNGYDAKTEGAAKAKESIVTEFTSKDKGDQFEHYIVSLFDVESKRFRLLDWRSDKKAATGLYALSNHLPDLVLDLRDEMGYHPFAIECKWRQGFLNGKIDWAKDYQIRNYIDFQNYEGIPVFVAIGVGGNPNNPKDLFLAELQDFSRYPTLYESYLKQFRRNPKQKFFFNPRQQKLS